MSTTYTNNSSSYQMACKFVSMLYHQGEIPTPIYERFCSTFLQKIKDVE